MPLSFAFFAMSAPTAFAAAALEPFAPASFSRLEAETMVLPAGVVDHLRVDALEAAEHRQTRTLRVPVTLRRIRSRIRPRASTLCLA